MSENTTFKTQVICPHCKAKGIYHANSLIDTTRDPMALQKVFNAEWFTYTCPSCGEQQTILYSCMFHDSQKNLLYAYADNEKDYEHMVGLLNGEESDDGIVDALANWLEVCTCRVTDNFSFFQEKLLLSYLGLDDRVVEICKYMTELILVSGDKVDNVENIYFNTSDDGWVFLIDTGEDELGECAFQKEMYEEVREKFLHQMNEDTKQVVVDRNWVKSVFTLFN